MRGTVTAAVAVITLWFAGLSATAWTQAPVVTEAKRREIRQAAEALTSETFADVLRRAEAGDVEAQVLAGLAFEYGKGVAKDAAKAVQWFRRAAEAGHPIGQNSLALAYATGEGLTQDLQKAVEWSAKAAAQGYGQAQNNLGWAYFEGKGVPENPVEAVRLFRLAAEQGNLDGQRSLAWAYQLGKGVDKNPLEAAAWYRKAVDQGDARAQVYLGGMYAEGQGVTQDYGQALAWFRKAAEQGDALGQVSVGGMYAGGLGVRQDYGQAVAWFRKAADQGDAQGQFNLGVMYATNRGVPRDDAQAVAWYRKAADQGLAMAQINLGRMYHEGLGVPQDDRQALAWYRKAADQGDAEAQFNLGVMYANAQGVPRDDAQALACFRKAADQGLAEAQLNLGLMYASGLAVAQDDIEAHKWMSLAAARTSGDVQRQCTKERDRVARRMNPAQLAEAQKRARAWAPGVRPQSSSGGDPLLTTGGAQVPLSGEAASQALSRVRRTERLLATVPRGLSPQTYLWDHWVAITPDLSRIAYVVRFRTPGGDRDAIVVGNQRGPEYMDVGYPALSPDGSRLAYIGIGAYDPLPGFLVLGESRIQVQSRNSVPSQGMAPVFSPDGRKVAFPAQQASGSWAVGVIDFGDARGPIDEASVKWGPEFMGTDPPYWSPDSTHIVYAAAHARNKWVLVTGTEESGSYEDALTIRNATFRKDGALAFKAKDKGKWFIVVGGERQPPFDEVSAPFFRPDGTLVYGASEAGKHFVVMGQSRSDLPHAAEGVVASADGQRMTYWYREGDPRKKGERIVINGQAGPYFDRVSRPSIDPETGAYSYTGETRKGFQVVTPLGVSQTYDGVLWQPWISEDGGVAGYVALIKDQLWWKVDRLR